SDWQSRLGSMTLTVGELFADYLTVNLVPDLIDWNIVKLVKVALHYSDLPNQLDAGEDFIFTKDKKASAAWKLPIKDKTKKSYIYNATFYLMDGSHRSVADTTISDDTIVLELPAVEQTA